MPSIFSDIATGLFCIAAVTYIVWLIRTTKQAEAEANQVLNPRDENVAGTGNGFSEVVPPPIWRTTLVAIAEWTHTIFMLSIALLFICLSLCLITAVGFMVMWVVVYSNQGVFL